MHLDARSRARARQLRVRHGHDHRLAGTTLLEVMIVLTILVFVVSVFHGIIVAGSGLQETNRQNAIAAEGARIVVERMRNEDFRDVFALFNADPEDDPDGPGTGFGHRFAVEGLRPVEGSPDGLHGEIVFPALLVEVDDEAGEGGATGGGTVGGSLLGGGTTGGLQLLGGAQTATVWEWHLLETFEDERLGMPRDLNGDSIIDDLDHSQDYIILPVRVRVEWQGNHGSRSLEICTMLVDFEVGR